MYKTLKNRLGDQSRHFKNQNRCVIVFDVPGSANADFRGRLQRLIGRRTTRVRDRAPDRISQATTMVVPIEEPSSGSDVSAMGGLSSVGEIVAENHGGSPELDGRRSLIQFHNLRSSFPT